MEKIDSLVGDKRFSGVARRLLQQINNIPPQRTLNYISTPVDSFPSAFVIAEYMNGTITRHWPADNTARTNQSTLPDFFLTLNRYIRFFDEAVVRAAVQSYLHGQPPSGIGWKVALFAILLHPQRKRDLLHGTREHEKYLNTAMALIPTVMLQPPSPMMIGALLSLVSLFW